MSIMKDDDLRTTFENYLDAFAATSPAEQERLLRSSLADDVVFTNPGVEGAGINSLLGHIEGFQKKFPGGRFRINWLHQQHGHALLEWAQLNEDGSELVAGHTYGHFNNEAGRITHLAGFWSPGAI
jgi:hypothetical protein